MYYLVSIFYNMSVFGLFTKLFCLCKCFFYEHFRSYIFFAKLDAKLKIGDLLQLKAEVQELEIVSDPELADEAFDMEWALNTAEVSKLFL